MLQYNNHRFHCGPISFQIPEGFILAPGDGTSFAETLRLYAPDESFTLELRVEEDCMASVLELASVIHDLEPTVVYPIESLSVNGLHGYHAAYRCRRTQYYEAWFDMEKGRALNLIIKTHGDILAVDTAAVFAAVDPRLQGDT